MTYLKAVSIAFLVSLVCVVTSVSAETAVSVDTNTTSQAVLSDSVNINTDSAEVLALGLKGIGVKRAQAIVAYREANGPFIEASQLQEVKGIGASIVQQNLDRIKL